VKSEYYITVDGSAHYIEITQSIFMCLVFITLVFYLYNLYIDEFKLNINIMLFFLFTENFQIIMLSIGGIVFKLSIETSYVNFEFAILLLGLFPIIQSFGFIFLKKTRDPLDGVSKLDFVYLVSKT
jgi:hypothetical protein